MSPLWTLHRGAILRWAGPWLMVQPVLVLMAFGSPRGAEILEGELVFVAALIAFGLHHGLSRERMEYLRQLPLERARIERSLHAAATSVILVASAFSYFSEVTGLVLYGWRTAAWALFEDEPVPVLESHAFRWPWINVFALPLVAYWGAVVALRLRRSLAPEPGGSHANWLGAGALLTVVFFLVTWVFETWIVPIVGPRATFEHDPWARNLPGAVALLLCLALARGCVGRTVRLGVDAYPAEESSWES